MIRGPQPSSYTKPVVPRVLLHATTNDLSNFHFIKARHLCSRNTCCDTHMHITPTRHQSRSHKDARRLSYPASHRHRRLSPFPRFKGCSGSLIFTRKIPTSCISLILHRRKMARSRPSLTCSWIRKASSTSPKTVSFAITLVSEGVSVPSTWFGH